MKFSDLEFKPHPVDPDGIKALAHFDNGYSASVFRTNFSVGRKEWHYEIFVMYDGGEIVEVQDLTDETGSIAPCDEAQVEQALVRISELPEKL